MPIGVYRRTDKHLKAMSRTTNRLWQDKDYREKQVEAHKGWEPSKETRRRMSEVQIGTKKPWAGKYKRAKSIKEDCRKHTRE